MTKIRTEQFLTKKEPNHVGRCRCGVVEIGAWAEPILVAACYCDDCQAAAERVAPLGGPPPHADGGTEFHRVPPGPQGAENLQPMRLTDTSKTRRMIAGCWATPMYVGFDDRRPWVLAFRARLGAAAPKAEMRICTRFRPAEYTPAGGLPDYPGYSPAMAVRILAVLPRMLFSRAVGAFP